MKKLKIIAEIGVNHNGDIKLAKKLIDCAVESKADYVKFQSYITKELVHPKAALANYQKKTKKKNQFELLKKYELKFDQQRDLLAYSKKKKIKFLSSPFDILSCSNLKKLGLKDVKIPSGEITNYPLLDKISKNFTNIFLSTGMSTMEEIKDALKILKKNKKKKITVMHCTSIYPTNLEQVNLNFLKKLSSLKYELGFSDHTTGSISAQMSLVYGVTLIEKHITLNKRLKGPDHTASMEPKEFKHYVRSLKQASKILGNENYTRPTTELKNKKVIRKSIFASKIIKKNEKLSIDNICTKRPEIYLPAKNWFKVLGRRVKKNVNVGDPILKSFIK